MCEELNEETSCKAKPRRGIRCYEYSKKIYYRKVPGGGSIFAFLGLNMENRPIILEDTLPPFPVFPVFPAIPGFPVYPVPPVASWAT